MYITKLPFEGKFKVTYPYGVKNSAYAQGYHPGIDVGNSEMPSIYSIVDGIVSYAGWENINNQKQGFGKYVSIKFDVNANGFKKVFLAHMSEIKCFVGQKVNPATIIGIMGSTGNSTGPHTHVEIREYNAAGVLLKILNPATFMGIPNVIGTYDSNNYKIDLNPPKPKFTPGRYKVNTLDGVNVRTGPGTNFRTKALNELSVDAKRKGGYINGTVFDVLEVQGNWGRGYSGWVCLDYCLKI
jgi:murein DD-endopeptidase MepM/ murein hydrolase activator NlpD